MRFTEAIRTCFTKYVTFSGRASRPEFWSIWTAHVVVPLSLLFLATASLLFAPEIGRALMIGALGFYVLTFPPTFCAAARRFHDTGRSGFWAIPYGVAVSLLAIVVFRTSDALNQTMTANLLNEPSAAYYALPGVLLIDAVFLGIHVILFAAPLLLAALTIFIVLAIRLGDDSELGSNKYGPYPLEVST